MAKTDECPFCNVEHAVAVPTVHSNGTSPEALREQLDMAVHAVRAAIREVGAAAPNARDYYPLRQDSRMRTEHEMRLDRLGSVASELVEMRDHVQEVIDFRAEQRARG